MAKPAVFATVGFAFSDIVRAARAMPILAVAAGIAGVGYILFYSFAPSDGDPGELLSSLALGLVSAILLAPIFIAIFRFIILNDVSQNYVLHVRNARFRTFCGWSIALFLVTGFSLSLLWAYTEGDLRVVFGIALLAAAFLIIAAFALVLPAVAADAPNTTLRNAVADIRGSFWRVVAIQALIYLPFLAVIGVAYFAFSNEASETSTIETMISSLAALGGELVWVAASARMFLVLADRLRSPASVADPTERADSVS